MLEDDVLLTRTELDELRAHLKNDPFNWPALKLMHHIDVLEKIAYVNRIKQSADILLEFGYSEIECEEIIFHIENGGLLDHEEFTCNYCDGRGYIFAMTGCFGGRDNNCESCRGSGRRERPCMPKEKVNGQ